MSGGFKKQLGRQIVQARKAAIQARLNELKTLITAARAERDAAIRGVQVDCAAKRLALRDSCAARRVEAKELGLRGIARAKHVFSHEKTELLANEALHKGPRKAQPRTTKKEKDAESDSAVKANLSPELAAVFDLVKRQIKGNPRKSRTEAFFQWAEENPGEVIDLQQRAADRELAKLIAEEERAHRLLKRRTALAGVPF